MPTTYPLPLHEIRLTINGESRTDYLLAKTLRVNQILGAQIDTASFSLKQPETWRSSVASIKPSAGQTVLIEHQVGGAGWSTIFGGLVQRVNESRLANARVRWTIACTDYTQVLTRKLLNNVYKGTFTEIIKEAVGDVASGVDVTTYVEDNPTVHAGYTAALTTVDKLIDDLAKKVGWDWYLDYDQALHFFPPGSTHASANSVTDTSENFFNLRIEDQLDQVRNRIWVIGGIGLSSLVFETFVGAPAAANQARRWDLDNPRVFYPEIGDGPFMLVDGVPQRVGTGNADASYFDYMLVQDGVGHSTVIATDNAPPVDDLSEVMFRYRYTYEVKVLVESTASQAAIAALTGDDGIRESVIRNASISSPEEARLYGEKELAQWASVITDIDFSSDVAGWVAGETITFNVTEANTGRTYSSTALLQQVNIESVGNQKLRYNLQCRAARFTLIDYYKELLGSRNAAFSGKAGTTIDLIRGPSSALRFTDSNAEETVTHSTVKADFPGVQTTDALMVGRGIIAPDFGT